MHFVGPVGKGTFVYFSTIFPYFTFDFWFNMLERVFWARLDMDNTILYIVLGSEVLFFKGVLWTHSLVASLLTPSESRQKESLLDFRIQTYVIFDNQF